MARHFMAFLGIGKYEILSYTFEGKEPIETAYVQYAIIKNFCSDFSSEDKLIFFLTDGARKKHWETLKSELEKLNIKAQIEAVDIPAGKTEKEIWEIFAKIDETIGVQDEIIFDITHAFRYIPMLAIVVLNYAHTVKKINLKGIYYGAYETGETIAPIVDITGFDLIFRWSTAINDFNEYGVAGPIRSILNSEEQRTKLESEKLKALSKTTSEELDNLSTSLATVRGKEVVTGEAFDRFKNLFKKYVKEYNKSNTLRMPPLERLFGIVDKKLGAFSKDKGVNNIVAALDWYVEHDLFQQGITMLREGVLTILLLLNDPEHYGDEDLREACARLLGKKGSIEERLTSIAGNFRKKLENSQMLECKKEEIIQKNISVLRNITKTALFLGFREFFDDIRQLRNDINHGGFVKDRKGAKTFIQELKKLSNKFKNVLRLHNLL